MKKMAKTKDRATKKTPARKAKSLAEQHAKYFVLFPYMPTMYLNDLRQPDLRPVVNSVVSGGAAEQPIESWSRIHAELGRSTK